MRAWVGETKGREARQKRQNETRETGETGCIRVSESSDAGPVGLVICKNNQKKKKEKKKAETRWASIDIEAQRGQVPLFGGGATPLRRRRDKGGVEKHRILFYFCVCSFDCLARLSTLLSTMFLPDHLELPIIKPTGCCVGRGAMMCGHGARVVGRVVILAGRMAGSEEEKEQTKRETDSKRKEGKKEATGKKTEMKRRGGRVSSCLGEMKSGQEERRNEEADERRRGNGRHASGPIPSRQPCFAILRGESSLVVWPARLESATVRVVLCCNDVSSRASRASTYAYGSFSLFVFLAGEPFFFSP